MMRAAVRNAAEAALLDLPDLLLVQIGRQHKLSKRDQLPAALIYTTSESQELSRAEPPRRYAHKLELRVAYYVKTKAYEQPEDELDRLADLGDAAILRAVSWLEGIDDIEPEEWETDGEADGVAKLLTGERTYRVRYSTTENLTT